MIFSGDFSGQRGTAVISVILIVLTVSMMSQAAAEPNITADSAALMEESTGTLIYGVEPHQPRPTASTTKIMTAIVALENAQLDEVVEVSENAAATGGSSMWLTAGEELTVHELLYGLMLPSGNDAAVALAEHISGSVEDFNETINLKAEEIGARSTFFKNPHGLPADNHFSTAYDLCQVSRYGFENNVFADIVSSQRAEVGGAEEGTKRILHNTNVLLGDYPGADGVKTGYTDAAGHCLVLSARRDGMRLIASVLHSDNLWQDARRLLDYGFANYTRKQLYSEGETVKKAELPESLETTLSIQAGSDMSIVIPKEEEERLTGEVALEETDFPLKTGDRVGYFSARLGEEELGRWPVLAGNDLRRRTVFNVFWKWISSIVVTFV